MNKLFACGVIALVGALSAFPLLNSCKTAHPIQLPALEQMSDAEFDNVTLEVGLLTEVAFRGLIRSGKIDPQGVLDICFVLDAALRDPGMPAHAKLLTDLLVKAGLNNDEALLAFVVIENFIRANFDVGSIDAPIGPRTRLLLQAVSAALKQSTLPQPVYMPAPAQAK